MLGQGARRVAGTARPHDGGEPACRAQTESSSPASPAPPFSQAPTPHSACGARQPKRPQLRVPRRQRRNAMPLCDDGANGAHRAWRAQADRWAPAVSPCRTSLPHALHSRCASVRRSPSCMPAVALPASGQPRCAARRTRCVRSSCVNLPCCPARRRRARSWLVRRPAADAAAWRPQLHHVRRLCKLRRPQQRRQVWTTLRRGSCARGGWLRLRRAIVFGSGRPVIAAWLAVAWVPVTHVWQAGAQFIRLWRQRGWCGRRLRCQRLWCRHGWLQ
mmetsp:Transcript_32614/g.97330  ORF Transcript_32614/g.97330 Transcript_32614/m.97330 type:complete len:274 (+) Transcript_32614:268-1089(+)